MRRALRNGLAQGKSFAAPAVNRWMRKRRAHRFYSISPMQRYTAICVLQRLGSDIQPVLIARRGAYHAQALQGSPASAVRGDPARRLARCSAFGTSFLYDIIAQEVAGHAASPHALDTLLLACILPKTRASCRYSRNVSYTALHAQHGGAPAGAIADSVKTRRYPYTRINRGLTLVGHAGINVAERPSYTIVGRQRTRQAHAAAIGKHGFGIAGREKTPM